MSTTRPQAVVPTGVSTASISLQELFNKFQELEQRVSYHDGLLRQLEELQAENAHLKKITNEQSEEIATLRAKLGSVTSSGHAGSTKTTKIVSQIGNVAAASAISAMEDGNVCCRTVTDRS
jgi:predicted RNase H-like nuclease (RuvC/YqgF family)